MPTRTSKTGSELFIVDNSDADWKVMRYLHDWCQLSRAIDIASGLAVQGPARDDIVVVVEKWESVAALEAHLIAPHMMEYRPKVKDFVKKVFLQILSPAE